MMHRDEQQTQQGAGTNGPPAPPAPDPTPAPLLREGVFQAAKIGLIGSAFAWHLSLVGMIERFAERQLIGEAISVGYTILAVLMLLVGYLTARRLSHASEGVGLFCAAVAGGVIGAMLLVLALIVHAFEIGDIFIFATFRLVRVLLVDADYQDQLDMLQVSVPVLSGLLFGLIGGTFALIPAQWRRVVVSALTITALIGLLQKELALLLPQGSRRWFFTREGLTYGGAVISLVIAGGATWARSFFQSLQARRARARATEPGAGTLAGRSWQWWAGVVLLAVFLLSFPLWSKPSLSNAANRVGYYMVMGLGLNMVVGLAGMLDLGFVAFYAIGAYTMAILTSPDVGSSLFHTPHGGGLLNFWEALPFSMLTAVIGGALLALPILKMRGDYLAIATLGFGEIIRIVVGSDALRPITYGAQGIRNIDRPEVTHAAITILNWFGIDHIDGFFTVVRESSQYLYVVIENRLVIDDSQKFYYLILAACVLAWVMASRLKYSRLGRAWMAIREDEDVAQAMGINRVNTKLWAFVLGAFLGGLSGGVASSYIQSVVARSFDLWISINVLCLIIVGGMGSLPGVLVGSLAMIGLPELLRGFDEYRMLIYGAVLVVMMLYRPQGLWPDTLVSREVQEHPPLANPDLAPPDADAPDEAGGQHTAPAPPGEDKNQ
jgi:branched-chain amino acid transport system permease protein